MDLARYLGRAWIDGRYDCADLVVEVARIELGLEIALPGRAASQRGRDAQTPALVGALCVAVDEPADGDVVLMRAAGRRHAVGHHVGVWHHPAGHEPHVLHCAAGAGTCCHPLSSLPDRGWDVTGVYRWRAGA